MPTHKHKHIHWKLWIPRRKSLSATQCRARNVANATMAFKALWFHGRCSERLGRWIDAGRFLWRMKAWETLWWRNSDLSLETWEYKHIQILLYSGLLLNLVMKTFQPVICSGGSRNLWEIPKFKMGSIPPSPQSLDCSRDIQFTACWTSGYHYAFWLSLAFLS